MLVTCPECRAKISADADPCPRCGFPRAGRRSKEHCEDVLARLPVREKVVSGYNCYNCGAAIEVQFRAVVESYETTGYYVVFRARCPKCGGLLFIPID